MDAAACRRLFSTQPVARLATLGPRGPHLVPIVFALEADEIYTAVDHKPKRSTSLQRLANIERDPRVAVLADHYDDDWNRLWWVRADGAAAIIAAGSERDAAVDRLVTVYPHYRDRRPDGPVIVVSVERWSGWRASTAE